MDGKDGENVGGDTYDGLEVGDSDSKIEVDVGFKVGGDVGR